MEHGGDSQSVGHLNIGPCYETVHKRTTRAVWTFFLFDHYVIEGFQKEYHCNAIFKSIKMRNRLTKLTLG